MSSSFIKAILGLLSQSTYTPQTFLAILESLSVPKTDQKRFRKEFYGLLDQGQIVNVQEDRFALPQDVNLVTGIIQFNGNGSALIFPERPSNQPRLEPVFVKEEDTHVALPGDLVAARLLPAKAKMLYYKEKGFPNLPSNRPLARVLRIIRRGQERFSGTLQKSQLYYYIIPDNPRVFKNFVVNSPEKSGLKPMPKVGDKVVVELLDWENRHMNPSGTLVQVLGLTHTPKAEFLALLEKYKLSPDFPPLVLKAVEQLPEAVRPQDKKNRLDCTDLLTFTIDPDDAKDFDDALSIEALPGGGFRVGVHIADVGAYVLQDSPLDREAALRGNSTYLVGAVIPMLPQALSNGLCSLVENEVRLTKSVFLSFNKAYQLKSTEFANTYISSRKRLTYKQAYEFLKKESIEALQAIPSPPEHQTGHGGRALKDLSDPELFSLKKAICQLWEIAGALRGRRMQKGSLDLDMPEVKIFVDKEGYPERIEKIENDESHQLVEEFMLAANEAVARALHEANMPYISRVHDKPEAEKLAELSEVLALHQIKVGDLSSRPQVNTLLEILKTHPQGPMLKVQFLRSLKQACYRATADGHYGLNKVYYAHFTSPIRRYADLVTHRVLDTYLTKQGHSSAYKTLRPSYSQEKQEEIAEYITRTEQNSTEAERESVKIKLLEYFELESQKSPKTVFEAIISDIRNYGFFVELQPSMAYGLVHISTVKDDIYYLAEGGTCLQGRRYKQRFALGQTVRVIIDRVDRYKRQLDFALASCKEAPAPKPRELSQKQRRRPSPQKSFKKKP